MQLGFIAALAVGDALGAMLSARDRLSYKWPNDVLVNGRKIAGILLESEITATERLNFLVVGIGINLISSPRDTGYPATSVAEEGLGEIAPAAMLEAFVHRFQSWEAHWREDGFAPVRAAWLAAAISLGTPIKVRLETVTLHGRFLDVDERGALLLESGGAHHRISAGEIFPANR